MGGFDSNMWRMMMCCCPNDVTEIKVMEPRAENNLIMCHAGKRFKLIIFYALVCLHSPTYVHEHS